MEEGDILEAGEVKDDNAYSSRNGEGCKAILNAIKETRSAWPLPGVGGWSRRCLNWRVCFLTGRDRGGWARRSREGWQRYRSDE